ncbi:MAG: PAS domain-containing protein, partial [Desulfobacula sp.]|nr:PAS domain-containing protein [Desulfobacula sp.]
MAKKPTYEELEQRLKRIEHELQEYRDDREGLMEEHSAGLLDSEAKVENLMDIVPIGLSISTPGAKGTITDINSTLFKIFGYSSKDEYLKIPASSHYYNPKDRKVFSELNKHGPVTNYETRFKRKDGTVFWGSLSAVTRITEDGNIEFVSVFEDITKRKQAQEALRESEARLAKAQQITHIGNWNRTIITNNKWWSDELYRIVGLSPKKADANDEAYIKYVHPDDLVMFKNLTEKALKEKKAYSLEYRIIRPDNEIRFVHEQGDITLDTKGNPTDLFGTVQDIT